MTTCSKCKTAVCRESPLVEQHTPVRIINRDVHNCSPIGILWAWARWGASHPYSYEVLSLDKNGRPWRVDVTRCEMQIIDPDTATLFEVDALNETARRSGWEWNRGE